MKVDRISYQKTFNIGPYLNERIGVEAQVDEGEDVAQVFAEVKKMVEGFHVPVESMGEVYLPETQMQPTDAKEDRIGSLIKQINSCKEKVVLESYRLIARANPQLQEAYDKKMQSLTSKEIV